VNSSNFVHKQLVMFPGMLPESLLHDDWNANLKKITQITQIKEQKRKFGACASWAELQC